MTATLEDLLRATSLTDGHIQLTVKGGEWSVEMYRGNEYPLVASASTTDDPAKALRAILFDDERLTRDLVRRYAQAPKFSQDLIQDMFG